MKQKSLSVWLKGIVVGLFVCGIIIYALIIPALGESIATQNPEFAYCFWPWLGFIWATGIPCFAVLVLGWRIATNIKLDNSFSDANAKLLKSISVIAAIDASFFFIGNIVMLMLGMNHPGIVLFSFFVVFIGVAVAAASAVLSHLVKKAAVLQDQSDWTI